MIYSYKTTYNRKHIIRGILNNVRFFNFIRIVYLTLEVNELFSAGRQQQHTSQQIKIHTFTQIQSYTHTYIKSMSAMTAGKIIIEK